MTGIELAQRHFFEGLDCLDRADFAAAEKHFRQAYDIVPARASVIDNLAGALVKLNRIDEARQLAQKSLRIDDTNALAWLNFGVCLQENREYGRAANAFRRALALDETLHEAWMGLGSACAELGESAEAATAWLALLKPFPRSANLLCSLSRLPALPAGIDILSLLDRAEPDEGESETEFETLRAFARAAALDRAGRHAEAWDWLAAANRQPAQQAREDQRKAVGKQAAALASAEAGQAATVAAPAARVAGTEPVSLFIVGPSRSGKTTLERLAGAIGGVVRGGETLVVEDAMRRVLKAAGAPAGHSISTLPPALHGAWRQSYFKDLRDRAGDARIFTNTLPGRIYDVPEIAALLANARFVFMKRDRDDATLRIYMKKYKAGNAYAYDIAGIRDHIAWYDRMSDVLAERLAHVSAVLGYEDMIADPQAALRAVADLCGVEAPDAPLPQLHDDRNCSAPYRDLMAAYSPADDAATAHDSCERDDDGKGATGEATGAG